MLQDEQTLRRTVAKNIAAYRKSHKDTQLDLARKLNYSDKSVSKWERGEGLPDVYILAQIAQLYGVTVSNLIGEEEPPKKANPHFHIYVLLLSVALVFVIAAILFTAFTIAAVARVLAFAEEFFIAHVRLVGMVGLHMLDVVVVVWNANQHLRRLAEIFFCLS